jgi:hypothetical protein
VCTLRDPTRLTCDKQLEKQSIPRRHLTRQVCQVSLKATSLVINSIDFLSNVKNLEPQPFCRRYCKVLSASLLFFLRMPTVFPPILSYSSDSSPGFDP